MTEAEWLVSLDPAAMAKSRVGIASDRKLRLLVCGACRQFWSLLPNKKSRHAVTLAERAADRALLCEKLQAVGDAVRVDLWRKETAKEFAQGYASMAAATATADLSSDNVEWAMRAAEDALRWADIDATNEYAGAGETGQATLARLVSDIFGNPFRPVAFDPRWRTADVTALARGIYEDRAFDRLPLLADALMDAGCDHADVLAHCRGDGPHVRGCWVVDLVLGKE